MRCTNCKSVPAEKRVKKVGRVDLFSSAVAFNSGSPFKDQNDRFIIVKRERDR